MGAGGGRKCLRTTHSTDRRKRKVQLLFLCPFRRSSGANTYRPSKKRNRWPRTADSVCTEIFPPAASKVKDPR